MKRPRPLVEIRCQTHEEIRGSNTLYLFVSLPAFGTETHLFVLDQRFFSRRQENHSTVLLAYRYNS